MSILAAALALALPSALQTSPPSFQDQVVAGPFDGAVGVEIDHHGNLFVWERRGRVFYIEPNGPPSFLLDLTEEVGSWGDHGLLGFALDPDFDLTGFVYAYYVVDYHHLTKFGTPQYDPTQNENGIDTIARVTRYRVLDAHDLSLGVDPTSRTVLIGDTISNGIPCCGASHCVGALAFGEDGTLFVSAGDGNFHASSHTCLTDGIIQPKEDVDEFRAQLIDSHSGKILRIDPATGFGLPSNPWYDASAPDAPRSRVWALGLRNPFRFSVRPGSGQPDPNLGDPGSLYIGDVGLTRWEELDVAPDGGRNFGWPTYEAFGPSNTHFATELPNLDAPNPLFGQNVPGVGTCTQSHFSFKDLLVQDALTAPSWPNPCDPAAQIPAPLAQRHTSPVIGWEHVGDAFVRVYGPAGALAPKLLGGPNSPIPGPKFDGNCSLGGAWPGTDGLPPEYHGTYFFADFGKGWIRNAVFDANDELLEVRDFADGLGAIVQLTTSPDGGLYYVNLMDAAEGGAATVRRISFDLDAFPDAVATPGVAYGPSPLAVALDGSGSSDPEGGALEYSWDFGDGTLASRRPTPLHRFPSEDPTAQAGVASRLSELRPPAFPGPAGPPSVVTDGVFLPPDSTDPQLFFATYHLDAQGQPSKNGVDWVGLTFSGERELRGLVFQEGLSFPGLGGWFETLAVEVRDAQSGTWSAVQGLDVFPPYTGFDGVSFDVHELDFEPATGDAVRIIGRPGGSLEFVTVAELRAITAPLAPPAGPAAYDVVLTVTDPIGQASTASVLVSTDNTPPVPTVVAPPLGATFSNDAPGLLDLEGFGTDAEHALLDCEWRVDLHHDNHVHPEDPLETCTAQSITFPHGFDGDTVYYVVTLTVTDPLGLATSVSRYLAPLGDCNLNGQDDALDIAFGPSVDLNGNGVPDECEGDCDGDGLYDAFAIVTGLDHDCDGDGVPDGCQRMPDCDGDGVADACAIALLGQPDLDGNGVPDGCQAYEPVPYGKAR